MQIGPCVKRIGLGTIFIVTLREIAPSQCSRETLDRIPQHRPGYIPRMPPEKPLLGTAIALSHLAQHPAHSLVNQIVRVVAQQASEAKCLGKLPALASAT